MPADAYWVRRVSGRPAVAVSCSANRLQRLAGGRLYPRSTLKKRLFRWIICTSNVPSLTGWQRTFLSPEVQFTLQENQKRLEDLLNASVRPAVFWPTDFGSRRRVHVHWIDQHGCARAFSKLGFGPSNAELLRTENLAIRAMRGVSDSFRVLNMLCSEFSEDASYLCTESLPESSRLTFLWKERACTDILKAIGGRVIVNGRETLHDRPWYSKICEASRAYDFHKALASCSSREWSSCRVHGDLGSENAFKDSDNKITLVDWERSAVNGPVQTDLMSLWLGEHHKAIRNDSRHGRQLFFESFLNGRDQSQLDAAILAIAYLWWSDFEPAKTLALAYRHRK